MILPYFGFTRQCAHPLIERPQSDPLDAPARGRR